MITQDMVREFLQKASAPDYLQGEGKGFEDDFKALGVRTGIGGGLKPWGAAKPTEAPKPKVPKSVNYEKPKAPAKPQEAPENNVVTNALGAAGRWANNNTSAQDKRKIRSAGNTFGGSGSPEDYRKQIDAEAAVLKNKPTMQHTIQNSPNDGGAKAGLAANPGLMDETYKSNRTAIDQQRIEKSRQRTGSDFVDKIRHGGANIEQTYLNRLNDTEALRRKDMKYLGKTVQEASPMGPDTAEMKNEINSNMARFYESQGAWNPATQGSSPTADVNIPLSHKLKKTRMLSAQGVDTQRQNVDQKDPKIRAYGMKQDGSPAQQEISKYMEYVDDPTGEGHYRVNPRAYKDMGRMQRLESGLLYPSTKYGEKDISRIKGRIATRPELERGWLGTAADGLNAVGGELADNAGEYWGNKLQPIGRTAVNTINKKLENMPSSLRWVGGKVNSLGNTVRDIADTDVSSITGE